MNERLDGPSAKAPGYRAIETVHDSPLDRGTRKDLEGVVERLLREVRDDQLDDLSHIFPRRVNDCVRTCVKRVGGLALAALFERDGLYSVTTVMIARLTSFI